METHKFIFTLNIEISPLDFFTMPQAWVTWTRSGNPSSCLSTFLDWNDITLKDWLYNQEKLLYYKNLHLKVNFLVTVKTNYRAVAYHNWAHGFHVCNSIYSILKASPGIYTPYEVERA